MTLGPAGMAPWGEISGPETGRLPARMLRREFAVEKKVRRATAYVCGLGLSEFYLNGKKVGNHVLSPGLTDYTKRALYVTYDVTKQLKQGSECRGRHPGQWPVLCPALARCPPARLTMGSQLLFQMRVEYVDGTAAEIVSDSSWKLTTDGPIRANNEYDGEEYDARQGNGGLEPAGFDDAKWQRRAGRQPLRAGCSRRR